MEQQLDKLTQLGTDATQHAISNYTQYFVIHSLCWIAFGAACAVAAWQIWRRRTKWVGDYDMEPVGWITVGLLTVIAMLTIPFNVPTLLQPRAYAIHQLIEDAR